METNDQISIIAKKLAKGGANVVFTGAGISTESGIPDYRSQGGLWEKFTPVYFDEFMSSKQARVKYWQRKAALYYDLETARPNPAHKAVTRLFNMGLVQAVITQNIDGLHQDSGIPEDKVIELHGNTKRVRCMTCGEISTVAEAQKRIEAGDLAPQCPCGGYLKPDTISFGQAMPQAKVRKAADLSSKCDFFMVVGSTLLVQPAALMPQYALANGAFLAILNLSQTPYDKKCHALINQKAGKALEEIADKTQKILAAL